MDKEDTLQNKQKVETRGAKPGEHRGGRKKGTLNKRTLTMREMAQPYCKTATRKLVHLMKHSTNESIVLAASKELLDRGYGKAVAIVESKGEIVVKPMSDLELARRTAFMLEEAQIAIEDAEDKIIH